MHNTIEVPRFVYARLMEGTPLRMALEMTKVLYSEGVVLEDIASDTLTYTWVLAALAELDSCRGCGHCQDCSGGGR